MEWRSLSQRLTKYAHFRLNNKSWATAEEIAQEAITQLLDPAYAGWDRERYPDLLDCLGSIVNGLVANHRKRKANAFKHVSYREDDGAHDDEVADIDARRAAMKPQEESAKKQPRADRDAVLLTDARTAEDRLTAEASPEKDALDALRLRLHGDAIALAIVERIRSGEGSPAAQAKALGVDVAEVYSAKRRIAHHAKVVAKSLDGGSESRS